MLRNDPGIQRVGPDEYGHLFDGLALLQMFRIEPPSQEGASSTVSYFNRFLRSDAFKRNMKAQRIVVTEFGTRSHVDPCKTILQRFMSYFTMDEIFSDNDLVGFCSIGDQVYAVADTPFMNRIDKEDLTTLAKIDLRNHVAVNTSTSHPHQDSRGNLYNMGSNVGTYNITKFPANGDIEEAHVVASIPTRRPFSPSYFHSFGLTENYYIFIEQPMVISIPMVVWQQYTMGSNSKILQWRPQYQVREESH